MALAHESPSIKMLLLNYRGSYRIRHLSPTEYALVKRFFPVEIVFMKMVHALRRYQFIAWLFLGKTADARRFISLRSEDTEKKAV